MVDATIIEAPPSTKTKKGERDPEMKQTQKGNAWHFGMKAHTGVDAELGLLHTVIGTAAYAADVIHAQDLLHGDETDVFVDAGDQGTAKREESLGTPVSRHVAMRPCKRRELVGYGWAQKLKWVEQIKASIRAKVENPFHIVKNLFRHRKTRYRGMTKNTAQLHTLIPMTLMFARRLVLNMHARGGFAV